VESRPFQPKKASTIVYMADLDDPFLATTAAAAAPSLAVVLSRLCCSVD